MNNNYDIVCFSHLRWSFVFQRPQHLLSRGARGRRVYFVEEPVFGDGPARMGLKRSDEGVYIVEPHLARETVDVESTQRSMLRALLHSEKVREYVLWYYTPMALPIAAGLSPLATVYDCMDELSAFKNAPACLAERELALFRAADITFTGGYSLYEAKKFQHFNVHAFPSSVDTQHFAKARLKEAEPEDQSHLPHPRLGFFGVIDERMDVDLLAGVAAMRPGWHLVILGPIVKIGATDLPRAPNIHYLGRKAYADLPAYIAGWDVALLPFARNEATRFISPTKTPEYLAAGKPVVSTSIRDVVRPYQHLGLARIADTVAGFVAACEDAMNEPAGPRCLRADSFLSGQSWDKTWREMLALTDEAVRRARHHSRPRVLGSISPANGVINIASGGE